MIDTATPLAVELIGKTARDYQTRAATAVLREFSAERASTLVVHPTGMGKTTVSAMIVANYTQGRILFLAPTEELVYQSHRAFREAMPKAVICIEMQGHRASHRSDAAIVVGSVMSVKARLNKYPRDHFSLIVTDEAHSAVAPTWQSIYAHFAPGMKHHLGLTATPDRHDGKAMGRVFATVADQINITQAVDDGWLVWARQQYLPCREIDLRKVHVRCGDFNKTELAGVLEKDKAITHIVENTIRVADGRKTAVYCLSVEQAKAVAKRLQEVGEKAVLVEGETPKPARQERIAMFANGSTQFLVNCATCTHGLDVPKLEVIAMTRPTASRALYTQIVGRCLRPFRPPEGETADARLEELRQQKKDALVLDFVGNAGTHSLVCVGDLLGGTFDDEVRREARQIATEAGAAVDMRDVYRKAKERVAERRKKTAARPVQLADRQKTLEEMHDDLLRSYRPHPFDVLKIKRDYAAKAVSKNDSYGATRDDAQKYLEEVGLYTQEIGRLSNQEQVFLCRVLQGRAKSSMCSYRQARLLHKYGYQPEVMTKFEAHRTITRIQLNGFHRPTEDGPNETLQRLIGESRQRRF